MQGQEHIVGEGKILRDAIKGDEVPSMIFWGPPGSGKTTLAWIIAKMTKSTFVQISAVNSGVKEFRQVIKEAQERRKFHNQRTILFIENKFTIPIVKLSSLLRSRGWKV